jgi:hypothetical protein
MGTFKVLVRGQTDPMTFFAMSHTGLKRFSLLFRHPSKGPWRTVYQGVRYSARNGLSRKHRRSWSPGVPSSR